LVETGEGGVDHVLGRHDDRGRKIATIEAILMMVPPPRATKPGAAA
jgi:hypothetical protein